MKHTIMILFLLFTHTLHAEIREIKNIKKIFKEITSDTLIVFDIDNTVLEPIGHLGSDQWYYYLIKQFQEKDKLSAEQAFVKANDVWLKTQEIIQIKTVEESTSKLISKLQKSHQVMALTARPFSTIDITKKQLLTNKIEFLKSAPYKKSFRFKLESEVRFDNGILYQGEKNNKGLVLVEFLKRIKHKPKKIIFIDDKEKHTKNMHAALEKWGIKNHIEYRYGHADKNVIAFNHDFAHNDLLFNGQLKNPPTS